jgi:APA family basic amino acid/polyamine antiporter
MRAQPAWIGHSRSLAYRRILVPLVANLESETAMALAAQVVAERGAAITAVVVVEVPPALPLNAHMFEEEAEAKHVLEDAYAIAAAHGVSLQTKILRARNAGEAIVEEAYARKSELVVLRAMRKQRLGQRGRLFGKTVDHVLKHAPCRVMVAAPPPRA